MSVRLGARKGLPNTRSNLGGSAPRRLSAPGREALICLLPWGRLTRIVPNR